jgi:hypothetical protein
MFSLLLCGVGKRLSWVGVMLGLLWLMYAWAVSAS